MVLPADALGYDDLTEFGRVTIERGAGGVVVTVDGFEFTYPQTCRTHTAKAMSWARDVLATAVEAGRLVPGGGIMACRGGDLHEPDAQR
ncbi:phage capsid protein [Burkholderia pseudomallei]